MPHIIVEYSKNVETIIPKLLTELHNVLGEQEGINPDRVKARATAYVHCVIGNKGDDAEMLHICLQLLSGRDGMTKNIYGRALHKVVKTYASEACSVTLEVRDMDRDTYCL